MYQILVAVLEGENISEGMFSLTDIIAVNQSSTFLCASWWREERQDGWYWNAQSYGFHIQMEEEVVPTFESSMLTPVPHTYINVSVSQQKTKVKFNVTFPEIPKCRYWRAWYDTLLGLSGTVMGVLNSIEIEEMNNRWKHAGGHIADSFTITSK